MKAIIGLLALMLVAMIPIAAAEVSVDASVQTSTDASVTDASAKTDVSADANASTDTMSPRDRMKERMRKGAETVKETRAVVKDVRPALVQTRAEVRAERAEIKALGEELKLCRGKRDDSCEKKRTDAKLQVKDSLMKAADEVLALLETTKTRVLESDAETKAEIAAKLDAHITAVTDAKAKVDALSETSTRQEINDAAKTLRKAIAGARSDLQRGIHRVVAQRFGGILKMTEQLEARLTRALEQLAKQGVDISTVDTAAFSAALDKAQAAHKEAADLYAKAQSAPAGEKADLMKQATEKMREAHAALKEAHQELRLVLNALKELRGGSEALASAGTESMTKDEEPAANTESDDDADEADNKADEADDDADEADDANDAENNSSALAANVNASVEAQ